MSASRNWAELSRENERLAMPSDRLAARTASPAPEVARGEVRNSEPALVPAGTAPSRQAPV